MALLAMYLARGQKIGNHRLLCITCNALSYTVLGGSWADERTCGSSSSGNARRASAASACACPPAKCSDGAGVIVAQHRSASLSS